MIKNKVSRNVILFIQYRSYLWLQSKCILKSQNFLFQPLTVIIITKDKFISPVKNDTVLIHYIGPTKPWHNWAGGYQASKPFIAAKMVSPWKNTPLLRPINSNQLRYCAKHMLRNKKYINGLFSYFLYFIKKSPINTFS
ncbi:hypothetical protein DSA95_25255 [Salmonella enterica subsp. enterica serovar Plymouth]|nr:hypothetical protein [Salmonella enterica subsp. enterica serovar Plymouth]EBX4513956.1 hypothetical protein [Salmonella enterica subsp. enterica serovar Plymouth]EBY2850745.1 hypothetical protein [Salmonella enterica subsp. enterica serovar Plymouth]EEE9143507.1 hypothetical protein [Salmonella enterica subsp. enterica serovar Plymouth]